jgi:hypothetical protein
MKVFCGNELGMYFIYIQILAILREVMMMQDFKIHPNDLSKLTDNILKPSSFN